MANTYDEKTLLEIKNLHAIYQTDEGTVRAVNGVDFLIHEKETVGLVGETGAGKTTMALAILRLLPERTGKIPEGEVIYKGEDLLKASEERMRHIRGENISMIFQDPMNALNPIMSVGDQILESLEIHHGAQDGKETLNQRVDELLELVGISPGRKHEYPHQFSGGMKQRIVIAIALACNPKLLIADEPTTALDVTIQAQVLALINDLQQRLGTSMIMITHDLGIVGKTCDKVAIMYAGEIIEFGTAEDVFNGEEHHPYTEGLFGAIPSLTNEATRLKPIEGLMPDPTSLPEGCKFHPRCPHCMEECKTGEPYLYQKDSVYIRCNLFREGE